MKDPGEEIVEGVERAVQKGFAEALEGNRSKIAEALFTWLSFTARKKPSADLADKLEQMRKRIDVLAEELQLKHEHAKTVVIATGEASNTLRMLERGTDWFDPAGNVTDMIVGAILD